MRTALVLLAVSAATLTGPARAQEPVAQPHALDAPEAEDPGRRVRWGLAADLGWHTPYSAFALGLEGHVGTQLGRVVSAYLSLGINGGVGFGLGLAGLGAQANGTLLLHLTMAALVELFLFDRVALAAGPAFGLGAMGLGGLGIAVTGGTITGVSSLGFKPGFDVRAGVSFGKRSRASFRRGGFNLGLEALVLFHPNATVTTVEGNAEGSMVTVERRELLTTVTPMLTLGYDAR